MPSRSNAQDSPRTLVGHGPGHRNLKGGSAIRDDAQGASDGVGALVSLIGAAKTYRMGEIDVHALRETTLDIWRGERFVLVGPSGSGKTTLLNLVGGMDRPTAGQVVFDGAKLNDASDRELTLFRRRSVGFVFQFFNLISSLTALENVEVVAELHHDPTPPMQALERVGLAERAGHFPAQLSGGEQQRVAVARAIVHRPPLLLCDEPTGSLDSETGRGLLDTLSQLNEELGTTLVIVTHDRSISDIAHRIATMRDGAIVEVEEVAAAGGGG